MTRSILFFIFPAMILFSCSKEKTEKPAGDIQIQSLTCTLNPIEAWDTTLITVEAVGSNLQYGWQANHGDINGSGKTVKYSAGECCVGLNTITCRVFNDAGEVSDTIMIRVTTHYHP
ncbi:MAG: hypothetical protein WCP32_12495 [Bacteroidota bacterium]